MLDTVWTPGVHIILQLTRRSHLSPDHDPVTVTLLEAINRKNVYCSDSSATLRSELMQAIWSQVTYKPEINWPYHRRVDHGSIDLRSDTYFGISSADLIARSGSWSYPRLGLRLSDCDQIRRAFPQRKIVGSDRLQWVWSLAHSQVGTHS